VEAASKLAKNITRLHAIHSTAKQTASTVKQSDLYDRYVTPVCDLTCMTVRSHTDSVGGSVASTLPFRSRILETCHRRNDSWADQV